MGDSTHRRGQAVRAQALVRKCGLAINPRDRVGLVGANGTGKTTMLRVLAGLETLDYGSCQGMRAFPPAIYHRTAIA